MFFKKSSSFVPRRVIILIIVLIAGIVLIVIIKNSVEKPLPGKYGITPAGIAIPKEVHAYTGKVESVEGGTLTIRASAHNNYLEEETILTVRLGKNTRIERYELPKNVPSGARRVNAIKQPIVVGEINIGDIVEVYSKKNVLDKSSFDADIVHVLK